MTYLGSIVISRKQKELISLKLLYLTINIDDIPSDHYYIELGLTLTQQDSLKLTMDIKWKKLFCETLLSILLYQRLHFALKCFTV